MRWIAAFLLSLALAMAAPNGHLKMYFVDVEGGQATLIVLPSGESLLVDAGWPGNNGRDAKRIVEAARSYGLKKIDYLLVTHYHVDHVGGVPELAEAFPIGTVIDHGADVETDALAQKMCAPVLLQDLFFRIYVDAQVIVLRKLWYPKGVPKELHA